MNSQVNRAGPQQNLQLVIERTFAAPRERVFKAWIEPKMMEKWFSPAPMKPFEVEANAVVGGDYRIGLRDLDGEVNYVAGKYLEIRPPERLVFTWVWQTEPPAADSIVTVEFFEQGDSTRVVLTHERLPVTPSAVSHRRGWEGCLENLALNMLQGEI